MTEMKREMIGRIERTTTTTGKPAINFYSTDTRLAYPILRLFNLSALADVGIDANELEPHDEVIARFWAYYTESDKLNQHGFPYKDVQYLEPIDTPATSTSVDTSALLEELRRIRLYLEAIARKLEARTAPRDLCPDCHTSPCMCDRVSGRRPSGQDAGAGAAPESPNTDTDQVLNDTFPRYANGDTLSNNQAEHDAYQLYLKDVGEPPSDVDALRAWIRDQAN